MGLDAQALQSLWTSSTGAFLTGRVLNVFGSQAYGAKSFHLVGVWMQVGTFVLSIIVAIIMVFWAATGLVLLLGQHWSHADPEKLGLVWPAWYYALVLATCLPARMLCGVLNQFLQCQSIMYPSVVASIVAMICNLGFGLVFVLGIPFNPNPAGTPRDIPPPAFLPAFNASASNTTEASGGFGFWSCPIVTATTE